MSSAKIHNHVGMIAGGTTAAISAAMTQEQMTFLNFLAEVLGGIAGGLLGANLPDFIEPATSSYHRKFFHSYTWGLAVVGGTVQTEVTPAQFFRNAAAAMQKQAAELSANGQPAAAERFAEFYFHFIAGAIKGLPAGYLSHLVCDATTPRGLPLLK
jgi:membrane-bound metal-dependent hydrolase YbcI (DUF457 family)